jgi:hypothetical protein
MSPATEATLTMFPFDSTRWGIAAFDMKNVPERLTPITWFQSSSDVSSAFFMRRIPATFASTSRRSKASTQASTAAVHREQVAMS